MKQMQQQQHEKVRFTLYGDCISMIDDTVDDLDWEYWNLESTLYD